jgi:3-deoxy-D-manno-octulosonic acid (KDO) 8-phosphate synthase
MLPMMNRDQQFDHRPVLAPLRLLGLHKIRDTEQVIFDALVIHSVVRRSHGDVNSGSVRRRVMTFTRSPAAPGARQRK